MTLSFNKEKFRLHFAIVQMSVCTLFLIEGRGSTLTEIQVNARERTCFNCSVDSGTSVDWQFQKKSDDRRVDIFIGNAIGGGGRKSNAYSSQTKYHIQMEIPLGSYDLIIDNVTKAEEGFYSCTDVSNPESFTNWRLNVIGEDENEVCSNDVIVSVGNDVIMTFMTAKENFIQLEHRCIGRNYPLHVFRDGRLVNDYYVLSGRFGFSASNGSWILKIRNVQSLDAGSFICSEDNGLGKQYAKELVVIAGRAGRTNWEAPERGVVCSTDSEPCNSEINLTCTANYSGNCPPRIQLNTDEGIQLRNEKPVITENTVSLTRLIDKIHLAACHVATQSSIINSTCKIPVCNGIEALSSSKPSAVIITIGSVVMSAVAAAIRRLPS